MILTLVYFSSIFFSIWKDVKLPLKDMAAISGWDGGDIVVGCSYGS